MSQATARFRPLTQYQEQNKTTRGPISPTVMIRNIPTTTGTRDVDLNESVDGKRNKALNSAAYKTFYYDLGGMWKDKLAQSIHI